MQTVGNENRNSYTDILGNDTERLKLIFEAANEGFFYMDKDLNVRFYNENFYRNFNINMKNCKAEDWIGLVHEMDRGHTLLEKGKKFTCGEICETSKYRVRKNDNDYIWVEAMGKNVFDEAGNFVCVVGSHADITEKVKHEEAMKYLAYHDELTGFYNRNKIAEILDDMLLRGEKGLFIYVDLKNFRSINDVINFEAGDIVLKEVGENILRVLPEGSVLGRNYGDEFMIIIQCSESENCESYLSDIYAAIKSPILFRSRTVEFDSRIGVFRLPCTEAHSEEIIRKTQIIISHMKENGETGVSYYDDSLRSIHLRKLDLERYIVKALKHNEFYVKYQPIFDIKTGRTVGFEALARWENSVLGNVQPNEFIPVAEKTYVIHELGNFVLTEACKFGASMDNQEGKPFISINISAIQIHRDDFVERVKRVIEESGIEKERVLLEITESATLESGHRVLEKLKELHAYGVGLSIDDFGTGYSSINSIISLPISHLKVDRSLIQKICTNEDVMSLVEMLIAFSHKANFKIVAEGVEDDGMLKKLGEINSDYGQGFFHSRPLTEEESRHIICRERSA